MNIDEINQEIKQVESGKISDGYHTFDELYEHRIGIYIALCCAQDKINKVFRGGGQPVWRSKKHSDGKTLDSWFILGVGKENGKQITYHLPDYYWELCDFAEVLEIAPDFDGHTSADVIDRLLKL